MFTIPTPSAPLFPGLPGDISAEIVKHMDVDQLVRLKGTCSLGDEYVGAAIHIRSRMLLDAGLRSYDNFVSMLVHCRAVVGGIAALYILYPYHGRPPFVDIFVPDDTYDTLLSYLLLDEGLSYRRVEPGSTSEDDARWNSDSDDSGHSSDDEDDGFPHIPQPQPPRYPPGVAVMHRFTRGVESTGGFSIVWVRSTTSCALLPITSELHTGLFNYVSPHGFCSSYTALTQARVGVLNPVRVGDDYVPPKHLRPAAAAWAANGWHLRIRPSIFPDAPPCRGIRSVACAAATRYFGDRHCTYGRVVPIRLRHIEQAPPDNDEDAITVVWWRGGLTCSWACHSGRRELVPGARVCLRIVAEES